MVLFIGQGGAKGFRAVAAFQKGLGQQPPGAFAAARFGDRLAEIGDHREAAVAVDAQPGAAGADIQAAEDVAAPARRLGGAGVELVAVGGHGERRGRAGPPVE